MSPATCFALPVILSVMPISICLLMLSVSIEYPGLAGY